MKNNNDKFGFKEILKKVGMDVNNELTLAEIYPEAIGFAKWIIKKQITFFDDTTSGTLYQYNDIVLTMEDLFDQYLDNGYESND